MKMRIATLTLATTLVTSVATAEVGSLQIYGDGTPGSGGIVPSIWASGTLHAGNATFTLELSDAVGGSSAFLVAGISTLNQPLSGFQLLVNPFLVFGPMPIGGLPGVPGAGTLSLPAAIPSSAALFGIEIYIQFAVSDPGAGPYQLAATRGLKTIGTDPPLLIAVGSKSGKPDPVAVIDPASGAYADWGPYLGIDGTHDVHFTPDGRRAVLTGGDKLYVVEVGATHLGPISPPVAIQMSSGLNSLAITPDGRRCYVLQTGPGAGSIIEVNIDLGSPTFSQVIGTVLNMPPGLDSLEGIDISANGKTLMAGNLGLGGGPTAVLFADIEEGSPTKNVTQSFTYLPGFTLDVALSADGKLGYAAMFTLSGCGQDQLQVIDAQTGLVQTTLIVGCFMSDIDVGPRGRYAYVASANAAEIVRFDLDPTSPSHLVPIGTGALAAGGYTFGMTLSPDGSTAYLVDFNAAHVLVIDTATMTHVGTLLVPDIGPVGSSVTAR